jgi:DNA-binding response OmpR family regulator
VNRQTVLVVEDEVDVLDILVIALENAGYRVVSAGDGREGLTKAREAPPHLVITDFMMPRMSGPDMVRALRAANGADVPAILISAAPQAALSGEPALFDAVLRKPFRIHELLASVQMVLGGGA